jgi:hypothetical protein
MWYLNEAFMLVPKDFPHMEQEDTQNYDKLTAQAIILFRNIPSIDFQIG